METATAIILVAGTMTFANEWYQTKQINWRVPVATLLLGAAFDGLAHLDNGAAISLAVMVLIGAGVTKFNGNSVFDTISSTLGKAPATATPAATTAKKA